MPSDARPDAGSPASPPTRGEQAFARLRVAWAVHSPWVLRVAIGVLAILAVTRFAIELWLLLGEAGHRGGVDLRARHDEVGWWFADQPVWRDRMHAGYPPASFVLLWPLLGWLGLTPVRWLWAALNLGLLGLGLPYALRESGAQGARERGFVVLLLLASYPIPVTLGNGQLSLMALGAMLAAIFFVEANPTRSWRRDVVVAALLLAALVKPSLTAPFFLVVLFRGRGLRPLLLAAVGYVALTALAMSFRSQPLLAELHTLLSMSAAASNAYGHAHIPMWLAMLGHPSWSPWLSAAALAALAAWVAKHRGAELWLLLGVTGVAGRMATYHGGYDDTMTLLALLALYRIAKRPCAHGARDVVAGVLVALFIVPLLAPVTMARMGWPWWLLHQVFQPLVGLAAMIFLAQEAGASRRRRPTLASR